MNRTTPSRMAHAFLATSGIGSSQHGHRASVMGSGHSEGFTDCVAAPCEMPVVPTAERAVPAGTTEDKCQAILAEVELMSDRLRMAVEERTQMERKTQELMQRADTRVQQLEEMLRKKESELLFMRGSVEALKARVEYYQSRERRALEKDADCEDVQCNKTRKDGKVDRAVMFDGFLNDKGGSCGVADVPGISFPEKRPIDKTEQSETQYNLTVLGSSGRSHVGHSALSWVKFLLERCFSGTDQTKPAEGESVRGTQIVSALSLLSDLQNQYSNPNTSPAAMNSLCTQFSNHIVALAEELNATLRPSLGGAAAGDAIAGTPVNEPPAHAEAAGKDPSLPDEESIMRCKKSLAEENLQLLQNLIAVESSSREAWNNLQEK